MQETRNLFHEDNVPKQFFAAYQPPKSFNSFSALPVKDEAFVVGKRTNVVKRFDLVAQNSVFDSTGAEKPTPTRKSFSPAPNQNKNSPFMTAVDFSPGAGFFPVGANNNSENLLELLLFYFDQIVYLNEISEKIRDLDTAAADGDIARVNSAARLCGELVANCGMLSAVSPLECLAQLKTDSQKTDAAPLISRVKKEFGRFRLALRENLEQLRKQVQLNNSTAGSPETN
jgi:hypothetical protein